MEDKNGVSEEINHVDNYFKSYFFVKKKGGGEKVGRQR